MTSQHTPGPWTVDNDLARSQDGQWERVISGPNGEVAALVIATTGDGMGDPVPDDERDANAHLIAAAPELLAVLQTLAAHYDRLCHSENGERLAVALEMRPDAYAAFAAIAKATGKE